MFVERRAIDLESGQARLVARAHFHAIVEGLRGIFREPHPQPLLAQLVMPEIAR